MDEDEIIDQEVKIGKNSGIEESKRLREKGYPDHIVPLLKYLEDFGKD